MEIEELSPEFLLHAYSNGYFPMPHPETNETMWFRPNPRAILPLNQFHVSKSFKRFLKKNPYRATFNQHFGDIMRGCADRKDTWISEEFIGAYEKLFKLGHGFSVEVWNEKKELVGGLYGVRIRGAVFAESMFSKETNASKFALLSLVERLNACGMKLLEVQFITEHLTSLGATGIPDHEYQVLLKDALTVNPKFP